ncbi:MAG: hypothetical protein SWC40_09410 [Thermodesulfobacteriota bacterium]|nr:hypothetical protein [Thermodesulfobacteriota bacterium]
MSAKIPSKTLAKTLGAIGCHMPDAFGLFWDEDGTMPWKEFLQALHEDPGLRFVRDAHLQEIDFLGIEMPFRLVDRVLRLKEAEPVPRYRPAVPPRRLYFAIRRKQYRHAAANGLLASGRPFMPLAVDKDLALRIARRRDPDPVAIDILAAEAHESGIVFLKSGEHLFLAAHLPVRFLVFPKMSLEFLEREPAKLRVPKEMRAQRALSEEALAGSFFVTADRLAESSGQNEPPVSGTPRKSKKGARSGGWKREARELRRKREL